MRNLKTMLNVRIVELTDNLYDDLIKFNSEPIQYYCITKIHESKKNVTQAGNQLNG